MSKTQRWFQLVSEVSVRPGQTGQQLAERFGKSERTILRDIEQLQQIGLVIHNENGYRFLTQPYLQPLALSREEVVAIMLAQQLAQSHLDPKAADALSKAVDKMRRGMGGAEQRAADGVQQSTAILPAGATQADITSTLLSELSHAVAERWRVTFNYQAREAEQPQPRRVEPLGLSNQEGRWYLHGFCIARQADRTFRLGRISGLRVERDKFEPRAVFSSDKAAFHQWDLGGAAQATTLTMNVSASLARWFNENRPHPTTRVEGTTVSLSVNDPDAYLRWFASLDDAELTDPPECRERLRNRLDKLRSVYDRI